MFGDLDWDNSEFNRGYQAALNDIHHPNVCRQPFEVQLKDSWGHAKVYAVKEFNSKVLFLVYKHGCWLWEDSNEYEPLLES